MCWPGETVSVDGKPQIVEYEFTVWAGKETSGVNIPAVAFTNIEDIRAALAAELQLPPPTRNKERPMAFKRLAAALGLAALDEGNEDQALAAVEGLSRRSSTAEQERDTARNERDTARTQLSAAQVGVAAAGKLRLDGLITQAIRDGKIKAVRGADGQPTVSAREARLRKIGAEPSGLAQVQAEIAELDVIVPVAKRLAAEGAGQDRLQARLPEGADTEVELAGENNPHLASELQNVAEQLGLKVEDMVNFHNNLQHEGA